MVARLPMSSVNRSLTGDYPESNPPTSDEQENEELRGAWPTADQVVTDTIQQYWLNFAKSGDPNREGLPRWPRYEPTSDLLLEIKQARCLGRTAGFSCVRR